MITPHTLDKNHALRVLIVRFGALGDVVLTLAAVRALKKAWPTAKIMYVTKAAYLPLVESDPDIDLAMGLTTCESFLAFCRRLKTFAPDYVLDLHGKMRSRVLRLHFAKAKHVTWRKRPLLQGLGVRLRLKTYQATMHIAARYHTAVERLAQQTIPRQGLVLSVAENNTKAAAEYLKNQNIDLSKPIVGMAPGTLWPTKRWPIEQYADIAKKCIVKGFQVVLTGSTGEKEELQYLTSKAPGTKDFSGQLGLGALAGIIQHCNVFVANDSGPMHMARALGVPTIALFGSTDPGQFDFSGHQLMFKNLSCSPCSLYGLKRCPQKHFRCLTDIEAQPVFEAVCELVQSKPCAPVLG